MKKLTQKEWEEKYIVGAVERFDQKNHMFIRPGWDPETNRLLEDWSFVGEVKEKQGYGLEDQALRWASRRGTMMTLFNTSKPNTGAGAKAIKKLMSGENSGAPVLAYKPPEGAKINVTDPEKVTRMIKKAAIWFGADEVGICRLDRRWVYSHTVEGQQGMSYSSKLANVESKPQEIPERFQYAVVMGYEMDYGLIRYFPTYDSNAATSMGYSKMAITNNYLSAFIRNLGFEAIDCSTNDVALSIPMAMQAGLGDLARNGLLITPKSGPRVRLSKVITDLPLVADAPIDFGVTEFCAACQICADRCPSQSIIHGERTVKPHNISNVGGVLKWPVDAEKCRMYWARGNKPCVACIAVCPYNKRDTLFHRLVRWFTDHIRWADPFYVKMDNLFGYGKARQPDNFWEEWQPRRH